MLGEEHHGEVRELLWSTRSQYNNLGYALGIPADTMTTIPRENFYRAEDCYDAVLREVLKCGVTQEKLAEALESRQLKYEQLAQRVRDHTFETCELFLAFSPWNRFKKEHTCVPCCFSVYATVF